MDWVKVERLLQPPIDKHCWFALMCMLANQVDYTLVHAPLLSCIARAIEAGEQKQLALAVERSGLLPAQGVFQTLSLAERDALYCTNREFATAGRALRQHLQRIDLLLVELMPHRTYCFSVQLTGRLRYFA